MGEDYWTLDDIQPSSVISVTREKRASSIVLGYSATSQIYHRACASVYTTNKIDLTNYSKLCFLYDDVMTVFDGGILDYSPRCPLYTSITEGVSTPLTRAYPINLDNNVINHTFEYDLSNISGQYQLALMSACTGTTYKSDTLTIHKVWLE